MNVDNLCIGCMREKSRPGGTCPHCGFSMDAYTIKPHQLEPLNILKGRYLLGRVLGEGGFGITYVALDLQKGKRVAIKELFVAGVLRRENTKTVLVDRSTNNQAFYRECKEKFLQEAELLAKLGDKKGVVDIYDFFEENTTAYIVMEYLEGDDLLVYLKNRGGVISFTEAFHLLRPVMKSLIEMHSVGVIHRDISPDNIRYLKSGSMKLFDLGGAKYTFVNNKSSIVLVKHGYAPREQYVSGYKIGPWMDVYAMAATLYRCITGKVPKSSIDRKSNSDIEKPTSIQSGIPNCVEKAILKGMSLEPEQRYMDMREFYQALKAAAGEEIISHTAERIAVAKEPDTDDYQELLNLLNDEQEKKRQKFWIMLSVFVVMVIGLITIGLFIYL